MDETPKQPKTSDHRDIFVDNLSKKLSGVKDKLSAASSDGLTGPEAAELAAALDEILNESV